METCIGRQQKISDWRNNKKLSEDKFMNRFEQVKGMEMPDAKKYLTELLGDKAEILLRNSA